MLAIRNFIDGRYTDAASGQSFDKIAPATGSVVASVPDSQRSDIDLAVAAARRAFPTWSRSPAAERSRLLLAVAERIETNLEKLALAECVDTGKPLRLLIQAVGPRVTHQYDRPWTAAEPRESRLVVIGLKGLDRAAVTRALVS